MRIENDNDNSNFISFTNRDRLQGELISYRAVLKRQLRTAFPLIGINLANTMEGFFTGIILGKVTEEALAAGSLIGSSNLILSSSIMAPMYASTILIREAIGANNHADIALLWRQSLIIGTALSSARIIMMKWALQPMLNTITGRPEVVDLVQQYYDFYIFGVMLDAWSQAFENFFLGIDKIPLVMCVRYSKLFTFALSAFMLAQDTCGGRNLGVAGISIAFGIQAFLGLALYAGCAAYKDEFSQFKLFQTLFIRNIKHLKRLWNVGWPIGISSLNGMSSEFVITILTARCSDPALAAREVSGIYNSLLYQPTDAISLGTSLLVSESWGEKRLGDAARFGNVGIMMGLISALIGTSLFVAMPTQLTSLFVDTDIPANDDLIDLMKITLLMIALSQLAESTSTISYRALAGLQDTLVPTILATSVTWICGLPLAYLLGNESELGFKGLLVGQGSGMFVSSLILFYRWIKQSRDTAKYAPAQPAIVVDIENDLRVPLLKKESSYKMTSTHAVGLFHSPKSSPINNDAVYAANHRDQKISR
jgi:MATE family multidrug resistance protein